MLLIALRRRDLERNVRGLESGDLVLVWILGIGFVRGTIGKMQIQPVGSLADQQSLAR